MINILLQDDTDTTRTFIPVKQDGNSASYRTAQADIPMGGQTRISAVWEEMKNGTFRASVKLEVPLMETASGSNSAGYDAAPSVAYVIPIIVTIFAPPRSTAADRAHAVRMLAHAIIGANGTADQYVNPATGGAGEFAAVTSTRPIANLLINLVPMT